MCSILSILNASLCLGSMKAKDTVSESTGLLPQPRVLGAAGPLLAAWGDPLLITPSQNYSQVKTDG